MSSRNKFKPNKDGSIDLYIQNESPGKDKEATGCPRRRTIHPDAAHVLAEGEAALDPRRQLENPAGQRGQVTVDPRGDRHQEKGRLRKGPPFFIPALRRNYARLRNFRIASS